ncbi:hypothetical protein [Sphingopyxis sp.]|uniref:hypothetical protein n=1 Tax=Sphingopyxis sp. TaxID=1908224 RepID=UPI0025D1DB5A|nr:hypothetical protein [Sphingopyxis sp.]
MVAIASATGVAQGAVPQIQVAFPTDAALTCPNILSEVKFRNDELDVLQDAMNKVEVNPSAETEAIAAAMHAVGLLSVMLQVPAPISKVVSGAGSMAHLKSASEDLKRAYAPLQTQFDFALDRMDYLHGLYQRRCAGGGR